MTSFSTDYFLKRVLKSRSLKAQYKAGLLNKDLALTDLGKKKLMEILALEYSDKLEKKANEIIKEANNN